MADRYLIVVDPADNVATAIRTIDSGETIEIDVDGDTVTVRAREDVPFGHKIALRDVPEGDTVVKYGTSIGYASRDIDAGEWIHTHNVESNYGRGDLADGSEARAVQE